MLRASERAQKCQHARFLSRASYLTSAVMISSTRSSWTLRTSGERHLTASDCTSDDWSLISFKRHLHMRRSVTGVGLESILGELGEQVGRGHVAEILVAARR